MSIVPLQGREEGDERAHRLREMYYGEPTTREPRVEALDGASGIDNEKTFVVATSYIRSTSVYLAAVDVSCISEKLTQQRVMTLLNMKVSRRFSWPCQCSESI